MLFITISFLLVISTSDQNPLSDELLACPDSLANMQKFVADVRSQPPPMQRTAHEVQTSECPRVPLPPHNLSSFPPPAVAAQTVMTLVMALLVNNAKVAAVTLVGLSIWVVWIHLNNQPFYSTFTNAMVVTMYGLLGWGAVLATAQVSQPPLPPRPASWWKAHGRWSAVLPESLFTEPTRPRWIPSPGVQHAESGTPPDQYRSVRVPFCRNRPHRLFVGPAARLDAQGETVRGACDADSVAVSHGRSCSSRGRG